jgi:prepilin-type N-terminal cleavage/methylation domain-containing protein
MKKGFTLVEILVAVTIFVMVISIVSMLFVQAIRGQRQNLAYQELLDQASYVMEYMSRSIRMARRSDVCTGSPGFNYATSAVLALPGAKCLRFENYKDECQYFCLNATKLVVATTTTTTVPALNDFKDLTSSDLTVSSFSITSQGWQNSSWGDDVQPLVTIFLKIEGKEQASVQIKTSISQRNLDR